METKFFDWKHDYGIGNKKTYIGNNEFRLETKFEGENSEPRLKTQIVDWKQIRLKTY